MGDFPYIDWLTREYKKKAETSGDWTDYLRVCNKKVPPLQVVVVRVNERLKWLKSWSIDSNTYVYPCIYVQVSMYLHSATEHWLTVPHHHGCTDK